MKRIWVDPVFHKKLKRKAAESDKSILELTQEMANNDDPFEMFKEKKRKKGFNFNF